MNFRVNSFAQVSLRVWLKFFSPGFRKSSEEAQKERRRVTALLNMMEPSLLQFYVSRLWLTKFRTFAEPGPISNRDFLCAHGGIESVMPLYPLPHDCPLNLINHHTPQADLREGQSHTHTLPLHSLPLLLHFPFLSAHSPFFFFFHSLSLPFLSSSLVDDSVEKGSSGIDECSSLPLCRRTAPQGCVCRRPRGHAAPKCLGPSVQQVRSDHCVCVCVFQCCL